ncbi:MAG: hypothetical protein WA414_20750 [Acidobacteriaceae bacterium]
MREGWIESAATGRASNRQEKNSPAKIIFSNPTCKSSARVRCIHCCAPRVPRRAPRVAAESIVRALIGAGAIGLLSTHDLALTQIADLPNLHGFNCSMESDDPSDPLRFDFLVKPGVSRRSSALALLQLIGIPALPPVDGLASPESLNALP